MANTFSPALVDDRYVAQQLCMSRSWVRKQRLYRRRGLDHVLDIDPVLIGSTPRYRIEDFQAWIQAQAPASRRN